MKEFFRRFNALVRRLNGCCGLCGRVKVNIAVPPKGFGNEHRCSECHQLPATLVIKRRESRQASPARW